MQASSIGENICWTLFRDRDQAQTFSRMFTCPAKSAIESEEQAKETLRQRVNRVWGFAKLWTCFSLLLKHVSLKLATS